MQKISPTALYPLNPTPTITRNLEEGLDYSPDWRNRVVQQYLGELLVTSEGRSLKLAKIIVAEPDEDVIDFVVFHLNGPAVFERCIAYAVRCVRANATNNAASKIKAMILADFVREEIAIEFGAKTRDIHLFEYLFFDVRRYLIRRTWLHGLCYPNNTEGRTPEEMTELRMLQIAFVRGKTGVREDILRKTAPHQGSIPYPLPLGHAAKKAVQRVSEFYAEHDLSAPPDEMDLKAVAFLGHHAENLDQPIFAAQVEDQQVPKPAPWSLEQLESIDWEKLNSASADVINAVRAHYRMMLRQKLAATVNETGPFVENNNCEQAYAIDWAKVLNELDALGFGTDDPLVEGN
jgi:hypothetical protein